MLRRLLKARIQADRAASFVAGVAIGTFIGGAIAVAFRILEVSR